ncbi:primosomal protein N' [Aliiglaciecola sp. M165]|uniref:primosomal protein N' n=1 Tax=Aliiglaciecola sp. M165 TaxID=2593649 RepID=UPI00117CB927|nr:primosomal protein N' [Aliiglaciecola sp. M165]TRY29096.1 primosomal protein N' [Aliiglaciecola sp. M165]
MHIIQVALPIPKRQLFDYLCQSADLMPGCRVWVGFGPRKLVGIVLGYTDHSEHFDKLKSVSEIIDTTPVLDSSLLSICGWLAKYYHHPIGEVLHTALPVALRKGESDQPKPIDYIQLVDKNSADTLTALGRAKKQIELYGMLSEGPISLSAIRQHFSDAVINALQNKGLAEKCSKEPQFLPVKWPTQAIFDKPKANVEQALAISTITGKLDQYGCYLLDGVTGSGKTEVYLQSIEEVLIQKKQILILVPEIGLTPQTVTRFEQRFGLEVGILHSNLTDNERLMVWQKCRRGELAMVIGTRSAIFTPMKSPGMIIVDEEHDASYKQQDGLRYHARDLAVVRAKELNIPLVLGSATPCLETLNNAISLKYHHLSLSQRAGAATMAKQNVLDITNQPLQSGLAQGMIKRIEQHLKAGSQVMLFVNRRGYAPALLCHYCGHIEQCQRCDKPYTVHKSLNKMQCHHCGGARPIPNQCKVCGHQEMVTQGVGTEQLEATLNERFPQYSTIRIDSDSVRGKSKLHTVLEEINQCKHQLLIGTQILSKGHHFPHVTLVVILDADGALFSADYRAPEHLAQLITQLSGRAGRAEKQGEMWLQSHQPGHPLLQDLIHNGYGHFARYALLERKQAQLPPYLFHALFRAEATRAQDAFDFLSEVASLVRHSQLKIIGPIPAIMEKRQGRFRMQLLMQCFNRTLLNQIIAQHIQTIENMPLARKARWSLDVDPQDFM